MCVGDEMNFTPLDINENSMFSTGCSHDVDVATRLCSDFRLDVFQTYETRFIVSIIIMTILILYQLFVKYRKPNYTTTDFYMRYVDYRIDFVMIIFMFFNIVYLFVM